MNHHPIIPWIGGKRRLAKHILPLIPEHSCYVEPFCGAAAIFFSKPESDVEIINDLNGELINLYRVVKHHMGEFLLQFRWALTSRQLFEWCQITAPETLTDIQRAARFFYLQKLSFGAKVDGQTFGTAAMSGPRLNFMRLEEDLSQAHLRLTRCTIENLSWTKCIAKYDRPQTFFYCDPPYWQTEGYGVDFGFREYEAMAKIASSCAGNVMISINDHPDIRSVFKDLKCREVPITYTVGGGQRAVRRNELIFTNWR